MHFSGFRLYDPKPAIVIYSRDIRFNENRRGSEPDLICKEEHYVELECDINHQDEIVNENQDNENSETSCSKTVTES